MGAARKCEETRGGADPSPSVRANGARCGLHPRSLRHDQNAPPSRATDVTEEPVRMARRVCRGKGDVSRKFAALIRRNDSAESRCVENRLRTCDGASYSDLTEPAAAPLAYRQRRRAAEP